MLSKITDFTIRFRTWLIGVVGVIAIFLPDLLPLLSELLNSPKIVAILPENWKSWAGAIGFVLMIWSRWRPATRADDAEVKVAQTIKASADPVEITVTSKASGRTKATING